MTTKRARVNRAQSPTSRSGSAASRQADNESSNTTRRVGVSIRISKDRANEVSTEQQEHACRAYCETRGWAVVEVSIDRGRSAYKRNVKRPGLERLLALLEAGSIDTIIVYRLDRLSRSVIDFSRIWKQIEDAGGEFVSVSESFDTTSAMGRAMLQIAVVFAELESSIKAERAADWHAHRNGQGALPAGRRMYGFTEERKHVPAEVRTLRRAAKLLLAGESLRTLEDEWRASGALTAQGHPLTRKAIRRTLTNPHVAGLRDYGDGKLVTAPWKPILSVEQWEQLVEHYDDPTRLTNPGVAPGAGRVTHLLSGIMRCGICGHPMRPQHHQTSGLRYRCQRSSSTPNACSRLSIDAAVAEEVVLGALLDELAASGLEGAISGPDTRALVRTLEAEQKRLTGMKTRGELSFDEWHELRGDVVQRLDDAREHAAQPTLIGVDLSRFDEQPISSKRMVIRWAFERIIVTPRVAGEPMSSRIELLPRTDREALAS